MKPQTFSGPDLQHVFHAAEEALGEDVAVVSTRTVARGERRWMEVVAVRGQDVERFRRDLDPGRLPERADPGSRPIVIALVGPTGSGKTTTAAKLALSPLAFGNRKVGLLSLDTYRVGALEQIQMYADVAGLPLEVVYREAEARGALDRLSHCDVVIVDTPGRGPRGSDNEAEWREALRALSPDEVHLVMPATIRFEVADAVCDAYAAAGVSHALVTKLDEVPGEPIVVSLATRLALPARWVTDGQEVPTDLRNAVPRLLESLARPQAEPDAVFAR